MGEELWKRFAAGLEAERREIVRLLEDYFPKTDARVRNTKGEIVPAAAIYTLITENKLLKAEIVKQKTEALCQ